MKTMTQHLLDTYDPEVLGSKLGYGYKAQLNGDRQALEPARARLRGVRKAYGLSEINAPILTKPESNVKLAKAKKPTYGLTLYHYVFKSKLKNNLTLNLCPNAGDCIKVCVISNGHGSMPRTQLAWRWRSDLLANDAEMFMTLLGSELAKAVQTNGSLLLRPNVNSDIQWERVVPGLVDGSVTGRKIKYYGYTKLPEYLDGNGDITPHYRVCYSHNETTPLDKINPFIDRGGSVAVVTNRKPKTNITQWSQRKVIDADLTDEWIFKKGVIGDLSAKGKAAKIVDTSNFVVKAY